MCISGNDVIHYHTEAESKNNYLINNNIIIFIFFYYTYKSYFFISADCENLDLTIIVLVKLSLTQCTNK